MSTSSHAFTVYNAAAGAGKTYTLVLKYLATLLSGEFTEGYRNILAITFTNKAVAEMKTRVLESLRILSRAEETTAQQQLRSNLEAETGMEAIAIQRKADRILKSILHNYAAFDIVTIDTFTHRVIRTFAHDLGIPVNFEIELDQDALLTEAVDAVISKIGIDPVGTQILLDFAMRNLEEDKNWDITEALLRTATLLFSENDSIQLQQLSEKTPKDFEALKQLLYHRLKTAKTAVRTEANRILTLFETKGITHTDFLRGSIPKHFQKLADGDTTLDTKTLWKQNIETTPFYAQKLKEAQKATIDAIRTTIETTFQETQAQLIAIGFYENVLKNIVPLSVLQMIHKELEQIKAERRILVLSEFNRIISEAIKEQPAPFIYERLGERYRDYFIDEFQDTSALQWTNLIPLIDNALASETLSGKRGRLTIVGDAKQAIYRWRGGKAEQFIALSGTYSPFSVPDKTVIDLPRNYRSHAAIIRFNNDLFTFLAKDLSDPLYSELYRKGNQQEVNAKQGGYVKLSFITAKTVAEEHELYPVKVGQAIAALRLKGYEYHEICILTRKQKEGVRIADYLTTQGIAITSSETLLLANAPEVLFSIHLLTWHIQPHNTIAKVQVLQYLISRFAIEDAHAFLAKYSKANRYEFENALTLLGIHFSFAQLSLRPLYDAVEYIISSFSLAIESPAYIQFFLDTVFTFVQRETSGGILRFLAYWERKQKTLSIVAPEGENAVRIMTIHKAKGLEFPCVIYPYADTHLYREIMPKTWLPVDPSEFLGFESLLLNYSAAIATYGATAEALVQERKAQLELDAFNVLYVALTRAEQQLYIISKKGTSPQKNAVAQKFSDKFIQYLEHCNRWNSEETTYTFGQDAKPKQATRLVEHSGKEQIVMKTFAPIVQTYTISIVTNAMKVWDTSRQNAIEKGNIIHDIMAMIITESDVAKAITVAVVKGWITKAQYPSMQKEITKIVTHPALKPYYSKAYTIHNEREILAKGEIFRPDRVAYQEHKAVVIDYKTGSYQPSHAQQITKYAEVLQQMGYEVVYKIIVYVGSEFTLKYI